MRLTATKDVWLPRRRFYEVAGYTASWGCNLLQDTQDGITMRTFQGTALSCTLDIMFAGFAIEKKPTENKAARSVLRGHSDIEKPIGASKRPRHFMGCTTFTN